MYLLIPAAVLLSHLFRPIWAGSWLLSSDERVVAEVGKDVILHCRLEPPCDVERLTLEWSRREGRPLRPGYDYVYVYRGRKEVPQQKSRSFSGRTMLIQNRLRKGHVFLKLTNVTSTDSGEYTCFIPKLNSKKKECKIHLDVTQYLQRIVLEPASEEGTLSARQALEEEVPVVQGEVNGTPMEAIIVPVLMVVLLVSLGLFIFFLKKPLADECRHYSSVEKTGKSELCAVRAAALT